jgi:hypothetical protein
MDATAPRQDRARVRFAGGALAIACLCGGCALPMASGDHYVAPPLGSSWVTSRSDSGSFGTAKAQVATTRGEQEWEGGRVISYESPGFTQLLRADGKLVAFKNGDKPMVTFDPPVTLAYPLEVGKTTVTSHKVTVYPSKQVFPMQITQKVEAAEEITVPAGTFKTFRIRWIESNGNDNTYWQSPELGFSVKTILTRTAAHSAGVGRRESELLSQTVRR